MEQVRGQQILSIIEIRVQAALGRGQRALVARNGVFLLIGRGDDQARAAYAAAGHAKFLNVRVHAAALSLGQQGFGGAFLRIGTGETFKSQTFQQRKRAASGYFHGNNAPFTC